MLRRVLLAVVYGVVFDFLGCIGTGAIAGGIAGANDPQNAPAVGAKAGREAVANYRALIAIGGFGMAAALTALGVLPGTKPSPTVDDLEEA